MLFGNDLFSFCKNRQLQRKSYNNLKTSYVVNGGECKKKDVFTISALRDPSSTLFIYCTRSLNHPV
jgi:hypothetical protein